MVDRPNILLISTDQRLLVAISACGNEYLCTLHMDAMAAHTDFAEMPVAADYGWFSDSDRKRL